MAFPFEVEAWHAWHYDLADRIVTAAELRHYLMHDRYQDIMPMDQVPAHMS